MVNRIDKVLTPEQQEKLNTGLTLIEEVLGEVVVSLTHQERKTMPKINVDNKVFVERAISVATQPAATEILPAFLKPEAIQTDLTLYEQMIGFEQRFARALSMAVDIRTLGGSEAYQGALTVKRLVDSAATSGVPGAKELADILGRRFEGQGPQGGNNAGNDTPQDNSNNP